MLETALELGTIKMKNMNNFNQLDQLFGIR